MGLSAAGVDRNRRGLRGRRRPRRERVYLFVQIRRVRANQLVLLGSGKDDLVDFAVSLQARMDDLHGAVAEVAAALSRVDRRVDGSVTNTSLVRYDAYEGAGGHQSASIALLDASRTGSSSARSRAATTRGST